MYRVILRNSLLGESIRLIFLLIAIFIVGGIATTPFILLAEYFESSIYLLIGNVVGLQIIGFMGVGILYMKRYSSLSRIRINKNIDDINLISYTVIATLFVAIVGSLFSYILDFEPAENQVTELIATPEAVVVFIIINLLIVGPAEEFLFRGVIQDRLNRFTDINYAIIITSILFALIHIPAMIGGELEGMLLYLLVLFTSSVIYGYSYDYSDNILVPMIAHGIYNSILLLQLLIEML